MELELIRTYYRSGTNGCLLAADELICFTIELPWRDNAARRSCIPEGRYAVSRRTSARYGEHLLLHEVPGRSLILIHPANDARRELKGCIAPVSLVTGAGCGLDSRKALYQLMKLLRPVKETIYLTIKTL